LTTLSKVVQEAQETKRSFAAQVAETQNCIEASLRLLPVTIKTRKQTNLNIPNILLQNFQVYEGIISMLFVHPCYFQKLLQSNTIDRDLLESWVIKVYSSPVESNRITNLVLALTLMVVEDEVKESDPSNKVEIHVKSFYPRLYRFLLNGQKCNVNFFKEIAEHVMLKIMIEEYNGDPLIKEALSLSIEQLEINKPENYFNLGCCINDKNNEKKNTMQAEIMIERHIRVIKKMETYLKNIFSQPHFGGTGKISKEISYLNKRIIEEYKYLAENKEKIPNDESPTQFKKRIDKIVKDTELLVIELFFGQIGEFLINSEIHGIIAPEPYKQLFSKTNLESLANTINSYFQQKKIVAKPVFDPLNTYLETHSKKPETIKSFITGLTACEDYDITLENITLITEETIEPISRYNAKFTIEDILKIQNSLIKFLKYPNYLPAGNNDPLMVILNYLGLVEVDLSIFSEQVLQHPLNLKINSEYIFFFLLI